MSLAQFILDSQEAILTEWQNFAGTISSASGLDRAALRDDAAKMLQAIARDMQTSQTDRAQETKSQGNQPTVHDVPDTAAEAHGVQRFSHGFDLDDLVSEYRALRASVIRLWIENSAAPNRDSLYELTRFNEGIDQALAESTHRFSEQYNRSRELFLGILSHDLRTPLHVILHSATKLMQKAATHEQQQRLGTYIHESAQRITSMVHDLLDVTRARLGGKLSMSRQPMDASTASVEVLQEFRILHPEREFDSVSSGDVRGVWDKTRLHQLLSNLVRNAIQHGAAGPITLTVKGESNVVRFVVHNHGEPIESSLLRHIFEPMKRGIAEYNPEDRHSLGLGLYIACTIAEAHHGTLNVESSPEHGTSFTACLPRKSHT